MGTHSSLIPEWINLKFDSDDYVGGVTPHANKKFELMLTRHAKAYSGSSSQIALVYLQPFRHNSLLKCTAQPKIAKKNNENGTRDVGLQGQSIASVNFAW